MHIGLLTNYNLYESKRYFCQKFKDALENFGVEVTLLDMKTIEENPREFLRICDPKETTFTCSFNSMIPTNDGQFLQDVTGVPHAALLVDPAFYYSDLLKSKNTIITCVDHFDCDFVKSNHFDKTFFWGHAVEKDLNRQASDEKIYDVVLIGSCYDHETLKAFWQKNMTKAENDVIIYAIEILEKNPYKPICESVKEAFVNLGYPFETEDDYLNKIKVYGTIVDNYVRGKDRTELIKAVSKNHTVHVFGGKCWRNEEPILGWDYSLRDVANVVIHEQIDFQGSLQILKKSKISLNSMPFFKNGTHERIFTSLACHAVPVNSPNLWVEKHFNPSKDLLIYNPHQLDQVTYKITTLLQDEQKIKNMIESGREKVMQNHTWDVRVKELFAHLESLNIF